MPRKPIAPQVFLAGVPLFRELDAASLDRLAAGATRRPLKRGERLFRKGDRATGMYVVVFGEINLVATTPSRGARLTGVVRDGQSFGEPVMFLERPAVVDAKAATDALVLHLPAEIVFAEIDRNPRFARRMIAGLSKRIEALVAELERHATGGGSARLAAYLLRGHEGARGEVVVTLPAPKAAIASQLNLAAETFSRLLSDFARRGLVRVEGRTIVVPDPARLAAEGRRR